MSAQDDGQPGVTSGRRVVTAAMMLALAVSALEQTVVSPAMPRIIASLEGVDIYPWVFSAFLLASTVAMPIYGKLADLLGRKKVLLFGLGLFTLGSILSGLSRNMPMLIAMRVVQGLGTGAVAPIVLTMIGDLFTMEERARIQGLFSGVWGVSSLAGPALGGWLTDQISWRWVFFVTVPFAAVAALILVVSVRESLGNREVKPIDWTGAGLLAGASGLLLLAVLGGEGRSWEAGAGLLLLAGVLLAAFFWNERRAADPVLPLDLLLRPTIFAAIAGNFLVGALLFGVDTYIPLYVQGVLGGTATRAGQTITPLFVTWSISVAIAAKVVLRLGFRWSAVIGSVLIASGIGALSAGSLWPESCHPWFVAGMVVMGLGMGPTALSYILSVQNAVPWGRRGVATSSVTFFRTIGGALGVGALGAALGYELASRLAGVPGVDVASALRADASGELNTKALASVRSVLGISLHHVFLMMVGVALLGVACSWWLPDRRCGPRPVGEGEPEDPTEAEASLSVAAAEL